MIVSVNWLKKFVDIEPPIADLAELIGARLVEIESIDDLGEKFKDVLVVKVVECQPMKDSDHLNVTKIDDGGKAKDIERDDKGLIQVVCGAPNVREGLTVAWLPPGSTVPATFADKEPLVLGARQLRGFTSNGMLASAKELDLFDDHAGIMELDRGLKAGQYLREALELDDFILDIENKSLTHRPDTFGIIGFAREVAGIQGKPFVTPEWLADPAPKLETPSNALELSAAIDDPTLSDRYQAVVLGGADEAAVSPVWMQSYLARSGVRPISAIVDITNYMMLLSGQPLHAFDYDKVVKLAGSAEIHVRAGRKKEKLKLLDGRTITLDPEDIVIAAGDKAIALAGAMGGAETEIDSSTRNIILESATFNLYNLRATQMRHGIFSEAITRFTKGQPAAQTAPVLVEAVRLMGELTGAIPVSAIAEDYPGRLEPAPISVSLEDQVNGTLGSTFAMEEVVRTLENVGFAVKVKAPATAVVTAPAWRTDIHIPEDVVEEIGRLNGFDSIAPVLPRRDFTAVTPDDFDTLRNQVRCLLVRAGANEVLTYSFVHGDMMVKAGQNPETAYRIVNSLSPDLQYYRQSLTPSLLVNIHPNIKAGYDHFALFEFNKFHTKLHDLTEEGVPKELDGLALVVANKQSSGSAAFYEAKRYADYLASMLGLEFAYEPLEEANDYPVTQPYEPRRSARIWDVATHERVGVVGEFKQSVKRAFKLPDHTAGFEVSPRALLKLTQALEPAYRAASKYPGADRDICFQVAAEVPYGRLIAAVEAAIAKETLDITLQPLDIYQAAESAAKNITLRFTLVSNEKTLVADEVNEAADRIITAVIKAVKGKVI